MLPFGKLPQKEDQASNPTTMKIQAKLYPQTNFPFAMEVHDPCLSPNSRKALIWVKTDKPRGLSL